MRLGISDMGHPEDFLPVWHYEKPLRSDESPETFFVGGPCPTFFVIAPAFRFLQAFLSFLGVSLPFSIFPWTHTCTLSSCNLLFSTSVDMSCAGMLKVISIPRYQGRGTC